MDILAEMPKFPERQVLLVQISSVAIYSVLYDESSHRWFRLKGSLEGFWR